MAYQKVASKVLRKEKRLEVKKTRRLWRPHLDSGKTTLSPF